MAEREDHYVEIHHHSRCRKGFPLLVIVLALLGGGIVLALVLLKKAQVPATLGPKVTLPSGAELEGSAIGEVDQWLGLRYAAPPEGIGRWAAPRPWNVSSGVYDKYGSSCLQVSATMKMSEDCLFLNVFRPKGIEASAGLPVFVWVHGGGYITGHADTYPGAHLSPFKTENQSGVILVTLNYRLAMLGFISLPGLTEVNFGLRDQIEAIEWTRRNIHVFGGDPAKITIGGESAGGGSVCWHYANPRLSFVKGVIAESPAPWLGTFFRNTSDHKGVQLAAFFNCSNEGVVECMRNVSSATLLRVMTANWILHPEFDVRVVVDSDVVQGPATEIFNGSHALPLTPILIGSNSYEGNLFAFFNANYTVNETKSQFEVSVSRRYGDAAVNVTQWLQDTINTSGYFAADARVQGQEIVSCGCQMVTNAAPVAYSFVFGAQTQNPATLPFLGSTHSTEMHFVFGAILLESTQLALEGLALEYAHDVIMPLWTKFIYGGTPWSQYNGTVASMMYFSENYTSHLLPPEHITQQKWDLCPEIIETLYAVS